MTSSGIDLKAMMEVLVSRTSRFLADEMDITTRETAYSISDVQRLTLRFLTSLMSVAGGYNMYLAFSFDEALIRSIYDVYTADVDIEPGEEEAYLEETAADIINMIIGNATADLARDNTPIKLSPPVIISQAKSVSGHKHAHFYTADVQTSAGRLAIMCIGPMELFDEQLNYKER